MTLTFNRLDPERDFRRWKQLLRRSKSDFGSYRGFDSQYVRLFRGDYALLRSRFSLERLGLVVERQASSKLMATAIVFRSRESGDATLGGLLFDPSLTLDDLKFFAEKLCAATGPISMAPFNGHLSLGLATPAEGTNPDDISFLCSPLSRQTSAFFRETGFFEITRKMYALKTPLTPDLAAKAEAGREEVESRGFTSRPLSVLHYKRDIAIYHRIVSAAMKGHYGFTALTFEEEWDVLKEGIAIFKPSWFRFLVHEGKEIGFCFAYPNYRLSNAHSDLRNGAKLLWTRLAGRHTQARLVYSGLHPDYQGRGLFKAVRHRVILEMMKDGVTEFESSYVDEANANSLANVASTGGAVSHAFELFRSRG